MLNYFHTMALYNCWINERIYDACSRLSDAERKTDKGTFFKSIHGTLNHLLLVDRLWMGRFTGTPLTVQSLNEELYGDFATLRKERENEDKKIIEWINSLEQEDLGKVLSYSSVVNPQQREFELWFALIHFFNHQTHHRGQVTTLLSQKGVNPGITDLIRMPDLSTAE